MNDEDESTAAWEDEVRMHADQPPGWAVSEARDELGDDAAWDDVAKLAHQIARRETD